MVTIESNSEKTEKILSLLAKRVEDLSPAFREYVKEFNEHIRKNFESEGKATNRKKWDALKEPYASRKKKKYGDKPILVVSGKLKKAASGGDGWVQAIAAKKLQMGINLEYATTMQYGSKKKNVSARPFLYMGNDQLDPTAEVMLIRTLNKYVQGDAE